MENDKKVRPNGCGSHSCGHCGHHHHNEDGKVEKTNDGIAVPDTRERLTIPKFSVDSAIFMVYTSHDGDKSMTVTRAVSYPKFENLLTDLGLFNQWLMSYYDDCELSIGSIPKDVKQDPTDVAMVTIKDVAKGEETKMVISICAIPNSQNLEETRATAHGKPKMLDLYSFSPQAFYKAFHFLVSDFENRLSKREPIPAEASSTETANTPPLIPKNASGSVKREDEIDLLLGTLADIIGRLKRR